MQPTSNISCNWLDKSINSELTNKIITYNSNFRLIDCSEDTVSYFDFKRMKGKIETNESIETKANLQLQLKKIENFQTNHFENFLIISEAAIRIDMPREVMGKIVGNLPQLYAQQVEEIKDMLSKIQ